MKKVDLRKAMAEGTAVAVLPYVVRPNSLKGCRPPPAKKAIVVALDRPRRAVDRSGWGSSTRDDGVRVRAVDGVTNLPGHTPATKWDWRNVAQDQERTDERIVAPGQVMAWEEHGALLAAANEARHTAESIAKAAKAEAEKINEYAGEEVARAEYQPGTRGVGRYTGRVAIDTKVARQLRKRAEG